MAFPKPTPTDVGISIGFMRRTAPELARDIVCGLDGATNLATTYGLTATQWQVLQNWPAFRQMVAEANEELAGSAGTAERARRKAALAISELGVQDMATIVGDPKANQRDRIAAFSELKDVAMLGAKQQLAVATAAAAGAAGLGGPLIQIMMPSGSSLKVGEAEPAPQLVPAIDGESRRAGRDQA